MTAIELVTVANIDLDVADLDELSLDELAEAAVVEYSATEAHLRGSVSHAIRCGQILLVARGRMQRGEFGPWLDAIGIWESGASKLMRLAHYQHQLPPEVFETWTDARGSVRDPSLNRAKSYLRGLPAVADIWHVLDDDTKEEARRLRATGMQYDDIGAVLGISGGAAWRWCNPERADAQIAKRKARIREGKLAQKALLEQRERDETERLVKAAGGGIAEAYSLLRRCLVALDRIASDATSEKYVAIDLAISHAHKAEDAIVAALRIERRS